MEIINLGTESYYYVEVSDNVWIYLTPSEYKSLKHQNII